MRRSAEGRSLGTTPLFEVALPSGTQELELRGEDGVRRRLKVRLVSGEHKNLRTSLQDVPVKQ